jgi:polyhydroxybutyrate depolymerase
MRIDNRDWRCALPRARRLALGVACALASWSALLSAPAAALTPGERAEAKALPEKGRLATAQSRHLEFGGLDRSYLVQPVPAGRGAGPYPVVVLLHGGTQGAEDAWRETSLPTLGEREGFIVVAPQGVGRHWNDSRGSTIAGDAASTADDVGFLKAVIAEVVAREHGDASAVFMVGASNGGFMTMRFACDAGETLRAAASVISNVPEALAHDCRSPRPLPWLAISGTEDPLIPFAGQPEGTLRRGEPQPALLSADETFRFWADRDGCSSRATRQQLTDPAQDDRRRWAESVERGGCVGGQVSRQVVMHGSGHVFPGLPIGFTLVERIVGPGAPEIDGGTLVWQHFKATLMRG